MRAIGAVCCKAIVFLAAANAHAAVIDARALNPQEPIRLIVPFVRDSGTDLLARTLGEGLLASWAQPVVVDNRPGAGGLIGSRLAADAAADGRTLLLANVAALAIAPAMRRAEDFSPARDLAPVTQLTGTANVMLVQPSLAVETTGQLIAYARAKPGVLRYASAGDGTAGHLAGELLKRTAKIELTHAAYPGSPAAMAAVLGNEAQVSFTSLVSSLPHVRSKKLRALAVTSLERVRVLPEVPTLDESGVKGFEVSGWQALLAPAATPLPIRQRLQGMVAQVLSASDIRERLQASGLDVVATTPGQFEAYLASEVAKWGALVRELNSRSGRS